MDTYKQILPFLPLSLRQALMATENEKLRFLEEIRLKTLCPPLLRFTHSEAFLGADGELFPNPEPAMLLSPEEMNKTVLLLTDSSFYALAEELRRGYITLPGGHRAGLCGTAVLEEGKIRTLRDISAINIRIARPISGLAAPLLPHLLDDNGILLHTLIVSSPGGGKTTLLRDIARSISQGENCRPLRVGIIDERSELAAVRNGVPQLAIGIRSDVLDGCPKAQGMEMMLRSMGPQVLVCDEIGTEEDSHAIEGAINGGVRILASAHGGDEEDILQHPVLAGLIQKKAFSRIILLSRRHGPGTVEWIRDGGLSLC